MDDKNSYLSEINKLSDKVKNINIPPDLQEKVFLMLDRAGSSIKFSGQTTSLEQTAKYIDWITSLPWNRQTQDNLDLQNAKEIFDKNHYGLSEIKDRVLEYLAVLKLKSQNIASQQGVDNKQNQNLRAPILCFVGLVGTGKTTLAYSIAEAMGRKLLRIPFGGMGSAFDLRGQSRLHPDSEPGQIIKSLRRAQTKNPVILLDEIDRTSDDTRADIMGVLVELLDPEQNFAFVDYYIDYPFDLSQVLFVATANNTKNISTAVLDRLEPIQMPSYTDEEKIRIGKDYIFPKQTANCGLNQSQIIIDDTVWEQVVRPLGFDAGIRTLERTINGICRKVARQIVEGKQTSVDLTTENIKEYLPKW